MFWAAPLQEFPPRAPCEWRLLKRCPATPLSVLYSNVHLTSDLYPPNLNVPREQEFLHILFTAVFLVLETLLVYSRGSIFVFLDIKKSKENISHLGTLE